MKYLIICIIFFFICDAYSQTELKKEVKQTIERFFDGFHKQDSIIIKSTVYNEIRMQTIGKVREDDIRLITDDFNQFLKSIVAIPKETKFEEKLLDFNIQVDGSMAHAWVKYEFWINNKFSHCGVNSFQFFNDKGTWRIIYLIDTRRKDDCQD